MESSRELPQQKSHDDLTLPLPPFDQALETRKWCIVGLAFCYVLSIALTCTGSVLWASTGYQVYQSVSCGTGPKDPYYPASSLTRKGSVEAVLLVLNLMVTLATECVGYIHATSLRWALYHEDRLRHNSNLRLFTSARHSMPNRWFVNIFWVFSITISYSCASQILITPSYSGGSGEHGEVVISHLSLITLGCCLLVSFPVTRT